MFVSAPARNDDRLAAIQQKEEQLVEQIEHCDIKLEWITGQRQQPQIGPSTLGVINLMSKDKGFKSILNNIRVKKANRVKLPELPKEPEKPDFTRVQNLGELIDEFHKFPKIYDSKPPVKKPEKTQIFMEEYEERKKRRELAMNHATRSRIRRAQFYCNSLTNLYVDPASPRTVGKPAHHTSSTLHELSH